MRAGSWSYLLSSVYIQVLAHNRHSIKSEWLNHDWCKRTHSQPPHTHSFIQRTFLKRLVCVRCVSQVALVVKNPPANAGDIEDVGLIPGLGRSPGGGHGSPLQCSCLDNPMDRGAWGATVYWGCTESDTTEACTCPHMLEDAYTHLRKANAMWWIRLPTIWTFQPKEIKRTQMSPLQSPWLAAPIRDATAQGWFKAQALLSGRSWHKQTSHPSVLLGIK